MINHVTAIIYRLLDIPVYISTFSAAVSDNRNFIHVSLPVLFLNISYLFILTDLMSLSVY